MSPGAGGPRRPSRRLERLVLAAGAASALALLAVAWRTGADPGARGELAAAELVRDAARLVSEEWDAWLARPEPPAPPRGQVFRWSAAEAGRLRTGPRASRVAPVDLAPDAREPGPLDLLLDEAARLERAPGKLDEALPLVRDALGRSAASPARPEAWLRCIQLARRSGDCDAARAAWDEARAELAPELVRGDTSFRVLAALAVAPCLDEAARSALQRELATAWAAGTVFLPDEPPRLELAPEGKSGWRVAPSPAREALWQRIVALDPGTDLGREAAQAEAERALQALARELGELPAAPADGRWGVAGRPAAPFLVHAAADGASEGFLVDPALLAQGFRRWVELPGDLALDLGEGDRTEGEVVRERTPLAGDVLGFRLRHPDRAALVRAERRRLFALRAALALLALATAAASWLGARAMRRERRLAELKSAFVAGVSHDLRTPLASILLLAENLEEGRVDGEAARERYYPALRREAARLRRLVDDALDFSRLERGEAVRVAPEEHDLDLVAAELAAEARERVEAAGGRLTLRVPALGEGSVDAFALRRAAWNLVDNALAHSGSQEVELELRRAGPVLVLAVTDAGRGVPAELRGRVFEPWASFGAARDGTVGTGLGLAIVRAIALAHGGDVRVGSGPDGRGARFELTLDVGHVPVADGDPSAAGRDDRIDGAGPVDGRPEAAGGTSVSPP